MNILIFLTFSMFHLHLLDPVDVHLILPEAVPTTFCFLGGCHGRELVGRHTKIARGKEVMWVVSSTRGAPG